MAVFVSIGFLRGTSFSVHLSFIVMNDILICFLVNVYTIAICTRC